LCRVREGLWGLLRVPYGLAWCAKVCEASFPAWCAKVCEASFPAWCAKVCEASFPAWCAKVCEASFPARWVLRPIVCGVRCLFVYTGLYFGTSLGEGSGARMRSPDFSLSLSPDSPALLAFSESGPIRSGFLYSIGRPCSYCRRPNDVELWVPASSPLLAVWLTYLSNCAPPWWVPVSALSRLQFADLP